MNIFRSRWAPLLAILNLAVTVVLLITLLFTLQARQEETSGDVQQEVRNTASLLWCVLLEGPDGEYMNYPVYSIQLLVDCATEAGAEVELHLPSAG